MTSNAGVAKLGEKVHLFYTARGEDGVARLGYARLRAFDQLEHRLEYPVLAPGHWFDTDGVEDPRVCVFGNDVRVIYAGKYQDMARPCEVTIKVDDLAQQRWAWSRPRLLLPNMVGFHNRNVAYFPRPIGGRYGLLHRPMMLTENVWISFSYDMLHWYDHQEVLQPQPGNWDDAKVGVAGPPLELERGWLLIYHGVEARTWTYRLGYVILDKERPDIVVERGKEPVLEPQEGYEKEGVTPNVVFSCGGFLDGNTLVLYYGAADKVVCVATADLPW